MHEDSHVLKRCLCAMVSRQIFWMIVCAIFKQTMYMVVERGAGEGLGPPWILKSLEKNFCFLSFGKKQISPLFASLEKFWKSPLVPPLEKVLPSPMTTYTNNPVSWTLQSADNKQMIVYLVVSNRLTLWKICWLQANQSRICCAALMFLKFSILYLLEMFDF